MLIISQVIFKIVIRFLCNNESNKNDNGILLHFSLQLTYPKKYTSSDLMQIDFKVNEMGDTFDKNSKLPQFATIQGFKGLNVKIVILVDVDKFFQRILPNICI